MKLKSISSAIEEHSVKPNDGYIDVELDEFDREWEEFFIRDIHHRVPEKGIKLQFLETVKRFVWPD
jgi:hypothetical protein